MADIITKVDIVVTMEVQHPEEYNAQAIRLAARGALRNALWAVENNDAFPRYDFNAGFYQHPFVGDENVSIDLGDVEFAQ